MLSMKSSFFKKYIQIFDRQCGGVYLLNGENVRNFPTIVDFQCRNIELFDTLFKLRTEKNTMCYQKIDVHERSKNFRWK